MSVEEESQANTRPRKSYMTNTRPLADVMFMIVASILLVFLGGALREVIGSALTCVVTALAYYLCINTLTVFRLPIVTALAAGAVTIGITRWLGTPDLIVSTFQMIAILIAAVHVLQAWRK
jgi:hypothetical protein